MIAKQIQSNVLYAKEKEITMELNIKRIKKEKVKMDNKSLKNKSFQKEKRKIN